MHFCSPWLCYSPQFFVVLCGVGIAFVGVVASAVDPLDAASGRLDNSESAPNPVFGENHGFTTKENTKAREVVKGQNKTDTLENWTKWVFVASAHKERWC